MCASITALLGTGLSCTAYDMQQPGIPSHDPDYNAAARGESMPSSPRLQNVPMCKGGERARACVLDERCHITEAGCQVCVCGDLR